MTLSFRGALQSMVNSIFFWVYTTISLSTPNSQTTPSTPIITTTPYSRHDFNQKLMRIWKETSKLGTNPHVRQNTKITVFNKQSKL